MSTPDAGGRPPGDPACKVTTDDHGQVRVITLNHPRRRNVLDLAARLELLGALRTAEAESRAVVLTGAGGFFSAGGDIRAMSGVPSEAGARLDVLGALAGQLVHSAIPVVAAVEGGAYGAGLSLVSAATYAVSGATARYEASFGKIGLAPDTGLSWTLPRRIGHSKARQMMLLPHPIEAPAALEAGLVDEVVDDGRALARAIEVATRLSELSAPMIAGVSRLLAQDHGSLDAATAAEARLQIALLQTQEAISLRSRFLHRSTS